MRTLARITLALAFGIAACRGEQRPQSAGSSATLEAEDAIVLIALADQAPDADTVEMRIVDSMTARFDSSAATDTTLPIFARDDSLPAALWRAWRVANMQGRRLDLPERLGRRRLRMVPRPLSPDRMDEEVYHVSRVGVSGDSALVEVQRNCGPVCGTSFMLLVTRDRRGRWRIARPVWGLIS